MTNRTRRSIFISCGILLFLILFFLPSLSKNYIVKNSKELIGAQISVDELHYNYLTSTLKIYDFKLFEKDEENTLISLDTIVLNLDPLQLIGNKIDIEALYVEGLFINTKLNDSIYNFDDILSFHSETDSLQKSDSVENPFKYAISEIEFKNSKFTFDNQDLKSKIELTDIAFSIPNIRWDQEHKSKAEIKFNLENGGFLESSININPVDGEFNAAITINELNLNPFYKYTLDYIDISSFEGILNSKIHILGNTNNFSKAIVSGLADIQDLRIKDKFNKKIFAADNVSSNLKNIDYYNSSYKLDSLKLSKPYVYFQLDATSNTMLELFKPYLKTSTITSEETLIKTNATPELYYSINNLVVDNGTLDYSDNLTGEKFDYHLSGISIKSDSIFSDANKINITSDMLLNNRGTLNATAGFDPSDFSNSTLDFRIENFLLSDINIYSKYYTGHNVLKGDFYYYSNSKITNGKINSENQLLLKNVSVANDRNGLFSLPLKFALFLLKDRNGDVNLNVPVRGDLNDPKVNVGRLVWSTLKNLIVKVATSPFDYLAKLVDGDPKEMKEIKFDYLQHTLSNKNKKQLDKLIKLEKKKDGLKIDLVYLENRDAQKEHIAKKLAGKDYFSKTKKDYLKHKEDFHNYIYRKVNTDTLTINQAVLKLVSPIEVDSISKIHSQLRLKNTKKYLKSANNFSQINLKISDSIIPNTPQTTPEFLVKFSMQK